MSRKAAECHPDRPVCAKGLCRRCYDAKWKRDKRASDPEFKRKAYEANKAWHKANPTYERERSKRRWKENPEKLRPLLANWWKRHPEKRKEYKQRYKANSREKYLLQMRNSVKKRKARLRGAAVCNFTEAQWISMKEQHEYKCFYCCQQFEHLTQDHLTPLSRGGAHEELNIAPACVTCNSRKGTKTMEEYLGMVSGS